MAPPCCMPPDGMSSVFCSAESAIGAIEAIDMHGHYGPTGELLLRNGTCPPHPTLAIHPTPAASDAACCILSPPVAKGRVMPQCATRCRRISPRPRYRTSRGCAWAASTRSTSSGKSGAMRPPWSPGRTRPTSA